MRIETHYKLFTSSACASLYCDEEPLIWKQKNNSTATLSIIQCHYEPTQVKILSSRLWENDFIYL